MMSNYHQNDVGVTQSIERSDARHFIIHAGPTQNTLILLRVWKLFSCCAPSVRPARTRQEHTLEPNVKSELCVIFRHMLSTDGFKYNGDLLEGVAQTGVETFGGPQPFMLYADTRMK